MGIHPLCGETCQLNNTAAATPMYSRFSVLVCTTLIVLSIVLFSPTDLSSEPSKIEFGMSPQEVMTHLGAPDRIASFEGKYLRDVPFDGLKGTAEDGQFVFIYRKAALRIQFTGNRVSGLQEGGTDLTNPTRNKTE